MMKEKHKQQQEYIMHSDELLRELCRVLDYNPETGEMTWKVDVAYHVKAGSPVSNGNVRGRNQIRFKGKQYLTHRLAWLLTHGKWPEKMIDHIDGNPLNNRIDNLRDVSRAVNGQNQRKAKIGNQSKFLGVSWHKQHGKFQARIGISGKNKHLGYFLTAEAAYEVYLAAKRELHEGNTL